MSSTSNNERHFEEEEWDDRDADPLVDNGEPGVKVRALYDYEAAESDELDFKAGTTKCLSRCTGFTPLENITLAFAR